MQQYQPPPPVVIKAVFDRIRKRANVQPKNKSHLDSGYLNPTVSDLIKGHRELPALDKVSSEQLQDVMIKKLRLCSLIFQFQHPGGLGGDENESIQGKNAKREMLVELRQVVVGNRRTWCSEEVVVEFLRMTAANLFRALPPSPYEDWDPEEDDEEGDEVKDPAWVHVKIVYELLFYFMVSKQVTSEVIHRTLTESYVQNLVHLFRTKDVSERDYLKNIIHRIYQRFLGFRPLIRKAIGEVLSSRTFKQPPGMPSVIPYPVIEMNGSVGIGELLEIWATIVSGFRVPLREDNIDFLQKVLIPMHKNRSLNHYHIQLGYCILCYVDKDPRLAAPVIEGLLKYWPRQSSKKELLFLQELEEVLDLGSRAEVICLLPRLFKQIGRCVMSENSQVAERSLLLWNKDVITTLTADHRVAILPVLYPAITHIHWNSQVNELAGNIVRMFKEMDIKLWERTTRARSEQDESLDKKKETRQQKWDQIRRMV